MRLLLAVGLSLLVSSCALYWDTNGYYSGGAKSGVQYCEYEVAPNSIIIKPCNKEDIK